LLRLRFSEYVDLIRSLGHRRVFPDLYSPSSKSLLGDRLYDEFMPVLTWACIIEGVDLKFVLHSIRHGFNSRLKAKDVSVEDRADLMGHGGDSETSERYADPILLEKSLEVITKPPNVTAHLTPFPIRLLPWVEHSKVAPFSRGKARAPKI
jgi:integrase